MYGEMGQDNEFNSYRLVINNIREINNPLLIIIVWKWNWNENEIVYAFKAVIIVFRFKVI